MLMIEELLIGIGIMGIILFILVLVLLPFVCTIILGTYLATTLGLTGLVWWSFVIIFYLVIEGLLGLIARI